jgi:hypothetical protein
VSIRFSSNIASPNPVVTREAISSGHPNRG